MTKTSDGTGAPIQLKIVLISKGLQILIFIALLLWLSFDYLTSMDDGHGGWGGMVMIVSWIGIFSSGAIWFFGICLIPFFFLERELTKVHGMRILPKIMFAIPFATYSVIIIPLVYTLEKFNLPGSLSFVLAFIILLVGWSAFSALMTWLAFNKLSAKAK